MKIFNHNILDNFLFEKQLLIYFKNKQHVVFLNSNDIYKENLFAVSDTNSVNDDEWKFGFITYDYKNKIEELTSNHFDGIQFPEKHFFTPELLFKINRNEVEIIYKETIYTTQEVKDLLTKITTVLVSNNNIKPVKVKPKITKEAYIKNVNQLKKHIQLGNIYEINYCQEYFAKRVEINPIDVYLTLNKKSPTPYSCFVKCEEKYLMSATPERFIYKKGTKIISEPIKGTIRRGINKQEDETLKELLFNDIKERSENVMIVDLVRNDLSKFAEKGSVKVEELCGIYTFPQVHQMISTISAQVKKEVDFDTIIKATFPMGSMTGTPKISALKLIEQYEKTKRGLYAGTVGYINKKGDFDFNVVIRSLQYNKENNYLSFLVGGAITNLSDPEKEYEECLLKAKAMLEVLGN